MLRTTPFHAKTAPICQAQNWRRWAGYVVAGSYELNHDREYYAIRSAAALIDVSPLFKYVIRGPDAAHLLDRVVTRNVAGSSVGQVLYTPWCNDAGKVVDDGTLSRLDDNVFRLTAAEPNLRWLHEHGTGLQFEIDDVSDSLAALSIQGPMAREILSTATDSDLSSLRFFRLTKATIRSVPVTISRTGYTGDLGYEVWLDAGHAEVLWDALIEIGGPYGLAPAGMLALDIARIEAGLLLIDVDYVPAFKAKIEAQTSSPLELGLGWAVKLDKGHFTGRAALLEESNRGATWKFVGLEIQWDSLEKLYGSVGLPPLLPTEAWRTSAPVYSSRGAQVGYATSGCWSPILKKYIALAHVNTAAATIGDRLLMEVTVEHHRKKAEATVVPTPFFDPPRKRSFTP